ncbi:uncharacterized protein LOC142353687 isoform X2 [Convolutriloba macropyga]|uniref:uncharacterized protein LOC142353687 isoform X2 n=1 Tax=Convolutriloba macropyga TaxID=536237 RepID=UPI003F527473
MCWRRDRSGSNSSVDKQWLPLSKRKDKAKKQRKKRKKRQAALTHLTADGSGHRSRPTSWRSGHSSSFHRYDNRSHSRSHGSSAAQRSGNQSSAASRSRKHNSPEERRARMIEERRGRMSLAHHRKQSQDANRVKIKRRYLPWGVRNKTV